MTNLNSKFWLSILLLVAVAIAASLAIGVFVYSKSRDSYIADKTSEAEALLSLTNEFVSTYSDIRVSHTDGVAPVPAEFRARVTKSFNQSNETDDNLTILMVGVPGKEIETRPFDQQLHKQISSMSTKSTPRKHTDTVKLDTSFVLRSVFPSVANKESCVKCHNEIQQGHQTWKKGDLMGAFVIDRAMDGALAKIRKLGWVTAAMSGFLILLIGVPLLTLRQKQQAATNLLTGALDAIDDPFIIYDENEKVVRHNRAFANKVLKEPNSSVKGKRFDELHRSIYKNLNNTNLEFSEWVQNQQKNRAQWLGDTESSNVTETNGYWFRHTVRKLSSGHVLELQADISELKRHEQEIEHSRSKLEESDRNSSRLALVAEHANDAVIITDTAGRCIWTNKAFTRLTGYHPDEINGQKPGAVLQGQDTDPVVARDISQAIRSGRAIRSEIINYAKDGSAYWIELEISPVYSKNGELQNFIAVERNISEQKQFESDLEKSKVKAEAASRSKSSFLANMSHEIRTPMNGVLAMSELLLESDLDQEQRDFVSTIFQSGNSLLTIINDVLDFSKIEAGKLELDPVDFNLRTALSDVISLLNVDASNKNLKLTLGYPDDLHEHFIGDVGRIRQIVTNLVGNAIKFTLEGQVSVTVSGNPNPTTPSSTDLKIEVADTGIGIPDDQLSRVFAEFEQVDNHPEYDIQGTGLGLAISNRLVKLMKGNLTVESQPGVGSIFTTTISLPNHVPGTVGDDNIHSNTDNFNAAFAPDGECKVVRLLVAEDNKTNQFVIKKLLKNIDNLDVHFAVNGREAIEKWKQLKPDIILMDVLMPEIDGMEATAAIRSIEDSEMLQRCPIIALTANAMRGDREKCIDSGMDDYLSKPISKVHLLNTLAKWSKSDRKAA